MHGIAGIPGWGEATRLLMVGGLTERSVIVKRNVEIGRLWASWKEYGWICCYDMEYRNGSAE